MIERATLQTDIPYIRVGTDYFKVIQKQDRFGITRKELKKWNQQTLLVDFNRTYLGKIPAFDDFIIVPDNMNHNPIVDNCYNMYVPFPHEPSPGSWRWTFQMLKHVFGTQFKAGMKYMKVLYENPKQALPILVLVSEERQTGKSTFLDWLNMLFGANMVSIEPDTIGAAFNGEFATKNIIAIDETILDKQIAVEKIKSLATKKFISVNIKMVQQFTLPFFGKIVLASNNEDKFMRVDDKEIRFWVRKLTMPKIENHNILNDMVKEIPAFLHYLTTMKDIDYSRSRMVLTAEEIRNEYLDAVVEESRSGLYKELRILLDEWFNNNDARLLEATPSDIKREWFTHDSSISRSYIKRVLKQEFNMMPGKNRQYDAFNTGTMRVGTAYVFDRELFTSDIVIDEVQNVAPF